MQQENAHRYKHGLLMHVQVRDVREQPADVENGTAEAAAAADCGSLQGPAASSAATPDGSDALPDGVLRPAVRPGERFAFCMTNPPFFESIEQAGLNPQTAHMGASSWRLLSTRVLIQNVHRIRQGPEDSGVSFQLMESSRQLSSPITSSQALPRRWCARVARRPLWGPWSQTASCCGTEYTGEARCARCMSHCRLLHFVLCSL